MEYRRATPDDVDRLVELRKQQLLDEGVSAVPSIDAELKNYFYSGLSDDSFIAWLAIENSEIIATSGLCFYQLPPTNFNPTGRVAFVTNMYTVKAFRRKGIASILLEKILGEARVLGYTIVRLHASSDGKDLYRKFGFEPYENNMTLSL